MSAHVPQQPDLSAVRALRLAAAALAEPLGALSITLAAAESLPSAFAPVLDLVGFTPFGTLDVPGRGSEPSATSPAARRQAPRSSGPAPGTRRDVATGRATGRRILSPPAPSQSSVPTPTGEAQPSTGEPAPKPPATPVAQPTADASAGAGAGAGAGQAPAAQAPGETPGAFGLLGTLVDEIEGFVQAVGAPGSRSSTPAAGAGPSEPRAPRDVSTGHATSRRIVETVAAAADEAIRAALPGPPSVPSGSAGQALATGLSEGAGAAVAAQVSALEALSRTMLSRPVDSASGGFLAGVRQAFDQATAAAAGAAANGQTPVAAANGAAVQTAPPEPAELAWLVNEALVEQARRHGMDLS